MCSGAGPNFIKGRYQDVRLVLERGCSAVNIERQCKVDPCRSKVDGNFTSEPPYGIFLAIHMSLNKISYCNNS